MTGPPPATPFAHNVSARFACGVALVCWIVFLPSVVQPQSSSGKKTLTAAQQASVDGLALVKKKRLDDAIETFAAGLKSDPQNLVLLNAIGAAYTLKGNSEQAREYFLQCLAIDPGFVPARKNLAIAYFNSGEYTLAVPELNKLADSPGASRRTAQLFLGLIAAKQKDYANTISALTSAGELLYQYPEALLSLAQSYFELRQSGKAESVLSRLNSITGVTTSEHFSAGVLYSQLGKNEKALAEFDRVRRASPEFPRVEYQRASALEELGRSQQALKLLEDSTKENPDGDSLNLLARVAEENHETALAFQSLRTAAKLEPEKEENYLDFSTLCMDHGNNVLALEAVDVGLSHLPDSYRLQVQKGAVLDKLNRFHEAEEILRTASGLQQDNSAALLSLGIVQAHAGKLEDAAGALEAAISKSPGNYYAHYFLGNTLLQLNPQRDPELITKAENAYQQSIRLNPSFADAYFQLAQLYLQKDPKLAEKNLVECLRRDPGHPSAEYVLAQLYLKTGRPSEAQKMLERFKSHKKKATEEEKIPGVEPVPN
jgi:tetratricopeptide (TPR) repeat protein